MVELKAFMPESPNMEPAEDNIISEPAKSAYQ